MFGALRAMESLAQLAEEIDINPEMEQSLPSAVQEALRSDSADSDAAEPPFLPSSSFSTLNEKENLDRRRHRHRKYKYMVIINETSIWDTPRFRHRGLLIDASRHFLPISIIKAHLDGMEMAKMNVLHWHMTDDESFPYQSETLPELSQEGAFDPEEAIYSAADVDEIVQYGRSRGIRIIPEFDTPGHVKSWGKSHPEILTTCNNLNAEGDDDKESTTIFSVVQKEESEEESTLSTESYGPLDPSKESTYTLLWQLIREVASRFPDIFIHLGGDEVDVECWQRNAEVREWMREQGMGRDVGKLLSYHVNRTIQLAEAAEKEAIVWQDAVDDGAVGAQHLPRSTVIQVWKWAKYLDGKNHRLRPQPQQDNEANRIVDEVGKMKRRSVLERPGGPRGDTSAAVLSFDGENGDATNPVESSPDDFWLSELARITSSGHRAILSAPWYVNLAPRGDLHAWERFWKVEPLNFRGSIDQKEFVIGGEACVWGEQVDETNALSTTWPLAAVVGERLWVDESVRDVEDARQRLIDFHCRLVWHGVTAAPLGPGYCSF